MAFTLPDLPYAHNHLEPVIDAKTMEIHHGKHHNKYVTDLNTAVQGTEWESKSVEELCRGIMQVPENIRTAVRNNAGGHFNHSLFWPLMTAPGKGGSPSGELAEAIDRDLGGLDTLKENVTNAGIKRFGSGWAWVCFNGSKLNICSTPNQDNPLMEGLVDCAGTPILGVDVWEHAYYLNYQNRRPDYLAAWWDVVNWDQVAKNFEAAKSQAALV